MSNVLLRNFFVPLYVALSNQNQTLRSIGLVSDDIALQRLVGLYIKSRKFNDTFNYDN